MGNQTPIIRQSAEAWTRRLLSGMWGAATLLDLQVSPPGDGLVVSNKDLRRAGVYLYERIAQDRSDSLAIFAELGQELEKIAHDRLSPGEEKALLPQPPLDDPFEQWQQFRREGLTWMGNAHVLFSFKQFAFLLDGFYKQQYFQFAPLTTNTLAQIPPSAVKELVERLKPAEEVPPVEMVEMTDFAFRTTFNQISFDLLALDRASLYHDLFPNPSPKRTVAERVMQADLVALHALKSMKAYLPEHLAVFTYIDRLANVRVVPYAPIALIGIPASSLALRRDLLAIAHEFGHFLYWNGHKSFDPLLTFSDSFALHWIEEIFADVVGCLIGGAAIALSFQDMALEKAGRLFIEDSGEHPTPALRPFVYIQVLERLGLSNAATALNGRWESILQQRLGTDWRQQPLSIGKESSVKLEDARNRLIEIADTLCGWFEVDGWSDERKSRIWTHGVALPIDRPEATDWPETLYTAFESSLPQEPLSDTDRNAAFGIHHWEELAIERGYLESHQLVSADGFTGDAQPIFLEKWLSALLFDGWNTGGPGGGVPHLGG